MIRLLIALLAFVAVASGCANIPDKTPPKVVLDEPSAQTREVGKPKADLDPFQLVQEFILAAGNRELAKTYLTEEARAAWKADQAPTIIEDSYGTTPPTLADRPALGVDQNDPDKRTVVFTAVQIGRMRDDRSYFPEVQELRYEIQLQRQADQQWRITVPPPEPMITYSRFTIAYRQVDLQFFDPELRVMVSDPRYLENEPREGLENRVVNLLLAGGPSTSLKSAVRSPVEGTKLRTNVVIDDGVVVVPLAQVDKSDDDKKRMAAQIVESLSYVTSRPVRILSQDRPLVPGHDEWRRTDVDSYDALTTPKPDLLGLVASGGRIYSMRDGKQLDGPAGTGAYDIVSAAQSIDGAQLAAVTRTPAGQTLRIGKVTGELAEVAIPSSATLTRPSWLYGDDNGGREVWTVLDGTVVIRAVRTPQGGWQPLPVDASALTADGGTITQLRLSRDGVRVAAVVNGEITIGSVVRKDDAVTISLPRTLLSSKLKDVIGVDWATKGSLMIATQQNNTPVMNVSVDGLTATQFDYSTLTRPVTAITAAPSRPSVVTDGTGMWTVQQAGAIFKAHPFSRGPGAIPFYPG